MDRSYASGAAGTAPSAPASPSVGYPTGGNAGAGTPATKPGAYWYHMIMEELMAIIVAAGITPASGTLNQLLLALRAAGVFITQAVSDDSTRVATTGWVRAAMSNIASAAGFAYSFSANGYIKFPSWLWGWIVQWGQIAAQSVGSGSANTGSVTFPLAFPNSVLSWGSGSFNPTAISYTGASIYGTPTNTGMSVALQNSWTSAQNIGAWWIAIGK